MSRESWTEAEAKARLSEAVDNAVLEGHRTVAKRGRKAVVIVDGEEWEWKLPAERQPRRVLRTIAAAPSRPRDRAQQGQSARRRALS